MDETRLYVGNLPYSVRDAELEEIFSEFGAVASANVLLERGSTRSKGFGFVQMGSKEEAQKAIEGLHGTEVGGRALVVNVARPMEARPPRREGGYRPRRDDY